MLPEGAALAIISAMRTKSKSISEILRQEIVSGKFDAAGKLPSEHQLMRRFSVARETVRGALKDLTDRELVDRRPGYGTFLADHASRLATQRFGVMVPDAFHPFYARICRGLEDGARRHGYTTLTAALGTGSMHERAVRAAEFADVCLRERVIGVFLQPLQFLERAEEFNRTLVAGFEENGIPVVLLDSDYVSPPLRTRHDLVGIDNTNAGYVLARHLIEAGARRIAYFSRARSAPTSLLRANGAGLAVSEAGLKWGRENIVFCDPNDARAVKRVFSGRSRPDAVIAVNDLYAERLLSTVKSLGLKVPGDLLLAGVNGDENAQRTDPPITTMVQPCYEIGTVAVNIMCHRIAKPTLPPLEAMLSAELVVRESSTPCSRARKGKRK